MRSHTDSSPKERHKITHSKAYVQYCIAKDREHRATYDLMPENALRVFQPVDHQSLTFQGLDEHTVLDGLLKGTLHTRVFRTHVFRQPTHLTDVDLTGSHENRNDRYGNESQYGIHGEEITESPNEHRQNRQRVRDGLREEVDDISHIKL